MEIISLTIFFNQKMLGDGFYFFLIYSKIYKGKIYIEDINKFRHLYIHTTLLLY